MSSLFELDIQNCKGVGPQRAKLFRKLGVPTVGDLLRLYPRTPPSTRWRWLRPQSCGGPRSTG